MTAAKGAVPIRSVSVLLAIARLFLELSASVSPIAEVRYGSHLASAALFSLASRCFGGERTIST